MATKRYCDKCGKEIEGSVFECKLNLDLFDLCGECFENARIWFGVKE